MEMRFKIAKVFYPGSAFCRIGVFFALSTGPTFCRVSRLSRRTRIPARCLGNKQERHNVGCGGLSGKRASDPLAVVVKTRVVKIHPDGR